MSGDLMWVTWSKGHVDLRKGASPSKSAPLVPMQGGQTISKNKFQDFSRL